MICVGMSDTDQAKYPSPHIVMYKIADKLTQIQKVRWRAIHFFAMMWIRDDIFRIQLSGSFRIWILPLKGHGNEADFLRFLHKSVRHRSLTLHFEPFRFLLRIRGDICYRKTLPDSPSRGVDKIAYKYNFFQTFK